jgi:DNA-binding LacI/PurR family transcriptional regulator
MQAEQGEKMTTRSSNGRPSLSDVARMAGVSKTTASVVLSRGSQFSRISEDAVRRVESSAEALGYVPHHAMRSVRLGRAEAIGLPLEVNWQVKQQSGRRLMTAYFDEIWSGMRSACQSVGYMPVQILHRPRRSATDRSLRAIRSGQLDGVVLPAAMEGFDARAITEAAQGQPVVLVDPLVASDFPAVTFDTAAGVALMVEHLRQLGHRRVLWLGVDLAQSHLPDREQAFIRAAWDAGIRGESCRYPDVMDEVEEKMERPRHVLKEYLRARGGRREFTAIACYSDVHAIGALRALHDLGIRVPEEVSVIGFDRIQSDYTVPLLTTIDHKLFEMGRAAARILFELIDADNAASKKMRGRVEVIEPELVVGETTGPAHEPA